MPALIMLTSGFPFKPSLTLSLPMYRWRAKIKTCKVKKEELKTFHKLFQNCFSQHSNHSRAHMYC
jgi:hypothetical protein